MERRRSLTGLCGAVAACFVLATCGTIAIAAGAFVAADSVDASMQDEDRLSTADLRVHRSYAWDVVSRLDLIGDTGHSLSRAWHRSEEVFAVAGAVGGVAASSAMMSSSKTNLHGGTVQSGEPQIIIITLYNDAASRHIRNNRLHERAQLDRLLVSGEVDREIRENRTIPAFPADAAVVLTGWWPVAGDQTSAMPVWDPELNPPRRGGNNYATWRRAVAVDSRNEPGTADVEFMGRRIRDANRVSLDSFQHVLVDAAMAQRTRQDTLAHKAAVIALGRELRAGDSLALVAIHVASKTSRHWVWATLWWHDDAERGAFAQDRPTTLPRTWRNYLLDVAFDAEKPAAADGGARVCFNPWLEARFPDVGFGGGVVSNCVACHRRASYPPVSFLPVTRGAPDLVNDSAYAPARLRTDFIWSVARQAR